jgi:hypothetical protein
VDSFSEGFSCDKMSQAVHFEDEQDPSKESVTVFEEVVTNAEQSVEEEQSCEGSNQEFLRYAQDVSSE